MNQTLLNLLQGIPQENHLMPFFWQHGESEDTLRHYMQKIHDAHCGAVCVESRPHPDFCGPLWWKDMDVIVDEAQKLGMQVWILDDDHFPTGHANGAVENAPEKLCRQSVYCKSIRLTGKARSVELSAAQLHSLPQYPKNQMEQMISQHNPPQHRVFNDNRLLGVYAVQGDQKTAFEYVRNLIENAKGNGLVFKKPEGDYTLYVVGVSRNYGPHRSHINMMDMDSCRLMIENVYQPHFEHYGSMFGSTIAGFFSDEPELGNGQLYAQGNTLGTEQDLPWSAMLEATLREELGNNFSAYLPLLWENKNNRDEAARIRYLYMDKVTRLVETCFSSQLGDWCRAHGVMYIGHTVEDDNQHTRTASSLGHYFRGLSGQDMAGVDDIGGQVMPGGEDIPDTSYFNRLRDGEFYHYMLGKLCSSHAAIDPQKNGRALCEIFGAYGWGAGVSMFQYLINHFLARGVNYFVPHAFNPKEYPDPDCPPHFYAHGNHPQYRHFSQLMAYTNRVCSLLSGGMRRTGVAVLYHAEAEWSGGNYMLSQKPARVLMDNQIDFDIIPADIFEEEERYLTRLDNGLCVNAHAYQALVLPMAEYIPPILADAVTKLLKSGFPVILIDAPPKHVLGGNDEMLDALSCCPVVPLLNLSDTLEQMGVARIRVVPPSNRLRVLYYQGNPEVLFIVNENDVPYSGRIALPFDGPSYQYDAWENVIRSLDVLDYGDAPYVSVSIDPGKSLLIVSDAPVKELLRTLPHLSGGYTLLTEFRRSYCRSKEHPRFSNQNKVTLPDLLDREAPDFSGFIRYETDISVDKLKPMILEISGACEGVEVFLNGLSAGVQIAPVYRFDLTPLLREGHNALTIEIATTLERETSSLLQGNILFPEGAAPKHSGFIGTVKLLF